MLFYPCASFALPALKSTQVQRDSVPCGWCIRLLSLFLPAQRSQVLERMCRFVCHFSDFPPPAALRPRELWKVINLSYKFRHSPKGVTGSPTGGSSKKRKGNTRTRTLCALLWRCKVYGERRTNKKARKRENNGERVCSVVREVNKFY